MCDFVSTIEKHDGDILFVAFLQNSDLETEAGKKLLAYLGTHAEDLCGHGAIVKYYELSGWTLPKWYTQKEYTDFSNPSTLPNAVVEAIKAGNVSLIGKPEDAIHLLNKRGMDRVKAYAAWKKADAAWKKAYADWEKAYADWKKADADREKTYADWKKADADRGKTYADREKADAVAFWRAFSYPSYRRKCWR